MGPAQLKSEKITAYASRRGLVGGCAVQSLQHEQAAQFPHRREPTQARRIEARPGSYGHAAPSPPSSYPAAGWSSRGWRRARAVLCLAGLYGLAKSRAGPLRPAVNAAAFLDRKVDDIAQELNRKIPPTLKTASSQAYNVARDAPEVARELLTEVQKSGVTGAGRAAYMKMELVAKELYLRYGPAAGHLAVSTWRSLDKLPLFPQVAQIAVPTAAHWAERYDNAIGFAAARYLPPIPTQV